MIIHRYINREIAVVFAAVTFVLLLIFMSNRFIRYLSVAASGNIPTETVFTLLALKSVTSLPVLLPLGFYLAVLISLGRLYRDSEMTALAACGVSLRNVIRGMLKITVVFVLGVLLISTYVAPWAQRKGEDLRRDAEASADLVGIASGRFKEISSGQMVFYTEKVSRNQRDMENIFAQREVDGESSVFTARTATQQMDPATGDRFMLFRDGYRYDGVPGTPTFKIIRFAEHGVLVERPESADKAVHALDRTTSELWDAEDPGSRAELHWRFAMPVSGFLLTLLAVVLSRTDPRQGRFAKLFVAILVYVVYSNLMGVARSWMANGKTPHEIGLWWVHVLLAVLFIVLWIQQAGWRWTWYRLTGKA